jgi:hypothetical protein
VKFKLPNFIVSSPHVVIGKRLAKQDDQLNLFKKINGINA